MALSTDPDDFGAYGTLVHLIDKNRREQIRVSINEFRNHDYIDIREFFRSDDGAWHPSKRGITLPLDRYPDLLQGVLELGVQLDIIGPEQLQTILLSLAPPPTD